MPDELDPEVPRLIFGSKHGFSQIIVSQVSMTLNVMYSPDWQTDITKGKQYLLERSAALYLLLEILEQMPVYFSGFITRVELPWDVDDATILRRLQNCLGLSLSDISTHDMQLKTTSVCDGRFYSNVTIQNYRTWKFAQDIQGIPRLSREKASGRGVEILGDFNDRYAFNEQEGYFSSASIASQIIDGGLSQLSEAICKVQEISK